MIRWGALPRVVALAAIPLNLSLAVSAISPLLPTIRHDTGLSAAVGGLLVTIPLFCFGIVAAFAPRLARRFGAEHIIALGFVLLVVSLLLRSAPSIAALFCGTLLLGAAACGNVLAPGLIKRSFGRRTGQVMGLYSTAGLVGSAVGAGATVPLMHATGWGWRATLALWATVPAVSLLIWLPQMKRFNFSGERVSPLAHPQLRRLYHDPVALRVTLYYGIQNFVYNGAVTWLPSIFVAHGVSQSNAGLLLAIVSLVGMIATVTVPVLAMRRPTQGSILVCTVALLAGGLLGLLVAPVAGAIFWMVLFGLGQGAAFSLGLSLILLRSADEQHANELSGMTLTFGFLFSAIAPVGLGLAHDLSAGWTWPLLVLLLLMIPLLVIGLGASRDHQILVAR